MSGWLQVALDFYFSDSWPDTLAHVLRE